MTAITQKLVAEVHCGTAHKDDELQSFDTILTLSYDPTSQMIEQGYKDANGATVKLDIPFAQFSGAYGAMVKAMQDHQRALVEKQRAETEAKRAGA